MHCKRGHILRYADKKCRVFSDRFELLYSDLGVVAGPGWTEANIWLPVLLITGIITFIFGV